MIKIEGDERDRLICEILGRIDRDTQRIGAPERTAAWEQGWADALHKFQQNPIAGSLIPAFIHNDMPVRWHGDFYHPDEKLNELRFARVMQERIGDLLGDCERIAEFGCGTGWNLVALAQRYPDKALTGYDFSPSSIRLVREAWNALNLEIAAEIYDMRKTHAIEPRFDGIFTFGAIEQLAGEFQAFMSELIAAKPKIVVHVEPTIELYDEHDVLDALAIRFHRKRGYTEGLLPWLQSHPRVNVLEAKRSYCGSLMHEGYSCLVWEPK